VSRNGKRRAARRDGRTLSEGQPRTSGYRTDTGSKYSFGGGANPFDSSAPKLQFGDRGELTPRTIEQAGLTGEEKERAYEMLRVQAAYLDIYEALEYPTDPDGHTVDLSGFHMTQPKIAIAWTLALLGFRQSEQVYIKKRAIAGPSVVEGAYAWVDVRAPDEAAAGLRPEHRASDPTLPPDTRRLAAQRDGDSGMGDTVGDWSVEAKVTWEGFEDR
jgi:hypothetical protein